MSELKVHKIGDLCFDFKMGKDVGIDFYLKSEADKVIADLEMKLARAQFVLRLNKPEALYSNLETMSRLSHKIHIVERRECHQKYKRCLAMASKCENGKLIYQYKQRCGDAETETGLDYLMKRAGWYHKWQKRWMELAEKFKEAK